MNRQQPLQVLICSANMGNAEPTPSTIAAWIPNDGDFLVINQSKYPIPELPESFYSDDDGSPFRSREMDDRFFPRTDRQFDIIAIGMQEATFNLKEGGRNVEQQSKQDEEGIDRRAIFKETCLNLSRYNLSNSDESSNSVRRPNLSKIDENPKRMPKSLSEGDENRMQKSALSVVFESMKGFKRSSLDQTFDKIITPLQTVGSASLDKVSQATDKIVTPLHTIAADKDHTKKGILLDHPATTFGGTKVLQKLIMSRCPSYECPVHYQRGEMRLLILVRKEIAHLIEDVDCKAGNTGVGSFLPNKGGIKVNLTIRKTRLSFVTAHLAAHEGETYYASRCSNITNIFDQTKDKNLDKYDCTVSSHHTFVFGDLNFRINLPNKEEIENGQHVRDVYKLIEKRDWIALNEHDELKGALEKGDCMFGFKALPCHFPPTFKVKREEGFIYNPQRTPGYTDRIVWRSSHGLKTDVKPLLYEPCASFNTSDHKAIRGAFSVIPREQKVLEFSKSRRSLLLNTFCSTRKLNGSYDDDTNKDIFISDISCSYFDDDQSKLLSPQQIVTYVVCKVDPMELVDEEVTDIPRTKGYKGSSEPSWEDELHLRLNSNSLTALSGSFLYITLVKKQTGSEDYVIGTVTLSLELLFSQQSTCHLPQSSNDFGMTVLKLEKSPLLKNGMLQGYLNCEIMLWLSEKAEMTLSTRHFVKKKREKGMLIKKLSSLTKLKSLRKMETM